MRPAILFLFLVSCLNFSTLHAQIYLGVSAGINIAKTKLDDNFRSPFTDSRLSSTVSLFGRVELSAASNLQLEASWIGRGFQSINFVLSSEDVELRYGDVGLIYLLDLFQGPVRIQLGFGPSFAYAFKGTYFSSTTEVPITFGEAGIKRLDLIFNGIIGTEFDLGNFKGIMDFRWQRGVVNLANPNDLSFLLNGGNPIWNRGLTFTLGLLVPLQL